MRFPTATYSTTAYALVLGCIRKAWSRDPTTLVAEHAYRAPSGSAPIRGIYIYDPVENTSDIDFARSRNHVARRWRDSVQKASKKWTYALRVRLDCGENGELLLIRGTPKGD